MIETVASADMLIDEVMRVKKNHLAPDFATGKEKRLSIVSGIHGDEIAGQYICYEVIRRIKKDFDKLKGIVDVYPFINPMGLEAQVRDVPVFDVDMNTLFPGTKPFIAIHHWMIFNQAKTQLSCFRLNTRIQFFTAKRLKRIRKSRF